MTSMYDVLKASKGLPVDDIFAQLWGRKLSSDYTIDVYTGTLPAVLTGTKAGYLHSYKIFGNTEQTGTPTPENPIVPSECGERTVNLLNPSGAQSGYLKADGSIVQGHETLMYTDYIPIPENASAVTQTASYRMLAPAMCFYDNAKNNISGETFENVTSKTFTVPNGAKFLRTSYRKPPTYGTTMLNSGSTALPYEPYGYKLPLASGSTPVDIYIGDDTLSTEEYVDSGTGKIYRMVSGTLTPIDPPVPFPQMPTSANSTTISWAGQGLAPSEVEFEYERK